MGARNSRKRTLGFSLIEVLLAMIIVAIGLLGILALQTASIRFGAGSRSRETAVYLCQTLLDSVQAEAERLNLTKSYGIPSTAAAKYLDTTAATGTSSGGAASGKLYFDVNGTTVDSGSPKTVYTVAWERKTPRDAAPNCFEFATTATWASEMASGGAVERKVRMNRFIRLD